MRKTEEVPAYHEMMQELFQAIKEWLFVNSWGGESVKVFL